MSLHVVVLACAVLAVPAAASAATWSSQTTPNPAGAVASSFSAVSCPTSSACTAVGTSDDGSATSGFAAGWASGTGRWTLQTVPAPVGAINTTLDGVSCTASNACTAVGSWTDSGFVQYSLIARWNGTSWALQTAATQPTATNAYLAGVVCTSSTSCRAVGSYVDGVAQPLTMSWNGTTWTTQTAPAPVGHAGTTLSSLSCTSSSVCTAVGTTVSGSAPLPYAAGWNGTRWSLQSPPTPAGAQATFMTGVSCTSSSACTSVGYATDVNGDLFPVAQRWNGTAWASQTPALPGTARGGALLGVSCTTSTACEAVGYSYDSNNVVSSLAELWNGTTWAVETTPNPAGWTRTTLNGVSCSSSVLCTAVGAWIDGGSPPVQATLGLRYS